MTSPKQRLAPSLKALIKCVNEILDYFSEFSLRAPENGDYVFEDIPNELYELLNKFTTEADRFLSRGNAGDERYSHILDMYFNINSFISVYEIRKPSHVFYYNKKDNVLKTVLHRRKRISQRNTQKSAKRSVFFGYFHAFGILLRNTRRQSRRLSFERRFQL